MKPLWRFLVPGRGAGIEVRADDEKDAWAMVRSAVPKKDLRGVKDPERVADPKTTSNVIPLTGLVGARHDERRA